MASQVCMAKSSHHAAAPAPAVAPGSGVSPSPGQPEDAIASAVHTARPLTQAAPGKSSGRDAGLSM